MKFWAFIMGGFAAVDVLDGVLELTIGEWPWAVGDFGLAALTSVLCVYYVRKALAAK